MNECKMSLFQNPIAPQRDPQGRILKAATLTPAMEVTPADVYQLITCNEPLRLATLQVRNAADIRAAKASLLPYVTPCGVFTRRRSDCLKLPSGLVVVDVDHLDSPDEAGRLKQLLFKDPYLAPVLVFISPTGRGVKAFVPCPIGKDSTEAVRWAMNYVHCMYDAENTQPGKGVDTSGKDLVRACFLCHDPKALLRKVVNFE